MMSDAEYREFLDALARKHLRLSPLRKRHLMDIDHLAYVLARLQNLRRLLRVAEQDVNDDELINVLANKLNNANITALLNYMERFGVIAALDEDPQTLFGNLRRSAVPDEDIDMLRSAGVDDPEAEILLIIHYCRTHLSKRDHNQYSDMHNAHEASQAADKTLERAAAQLGRSNGTAPLVNQFGEKKKRKIFNGVGKILSGGVLGAGNILLGCGGVIAPNPAIAYGVIGSCAVAIGSIFQGVGDLRGE